MNEPLLKELTDEASRTSERITDFMVREFSEKTELTTAIIALAMTCRHLVEAHKKNGATAELIDFEKDMCVSLMRADILGSSQAGVAPGERAGDEPVRGQGEGDSS